MQVVTPAPGGPADKAGLQAGDIIVAIDGKPTNGASLYDAGDMLQGAEGSEVSTAVAIFCAVPCCAVLCCAMLCCAVCIQHATLAGKPCCVVLALSRGLPHAAPYHHLVY